MRDFDLSFLFFSLFLFFFLFIYYYFLFFFLFIFWRFLSRSSIQRTRHVRWSDTNRTFLPVRFSLSLRGIRNSWRSSVDRSLAFPINVIKNSVSVRCQYFYTSNDLPRAEWSLRRKCHRRRRCTCHTPGYIYIHAQTFVTFPPIRREFEANFVFSPFLRNFIFFSFSILLFIFFCYFSFSLSFPFN